MATDPNVPTQSPDALTPAATRDPINHQQVRTDETSNRANADAPDVGTDAAAKPGERVVGNSAGPDTTGAVAPPGIANQPGSSIDLDGTPGGLASGDTGRQGNF